MKPNARLVPILVFATSTFACSGDIGQIVIMGTNGDQTGEDATTFDVAFQTSLRHRPAPKTFTGTIVVDDRARGRETQRGREVCRGTFGPADLDWSARPDKVARVRVQTKCPPLAADHARYGLVEIAVPGNTPPVLRGDVWMHGASSSEASPRSSSSSWPSPAP